MWPWPPAGRAPDVERVLSHQLRRAAREAGDPDTHGHEGDALQARQVCASSSLAGSDKHWAGSQATLGRAFALPGTREETANPEGPAHCGSQNGGLLSGAAHAHAAGDTARTGRPGQEALGSRVKSGAWGGTSRAPNRADLSRPQAAGLGEGRSGERQRVEAKLLTQRTTDYDPVTNELREAKQLA